MFLTFSWDCSFQPTLKNRGFVKCWLFAGIFECIPREYGPNVFYLASLESEEVEKNSKSCSINTLRLWSGRRDLRLNDRQWIKRCWIESNPYWSLGKQAPEKAASHHLPWKIFLRHLINLSCLPACLVFISSSTCFEFRDLISRLLLSLAKSGLKSTVVSGKCVA